MLLNPPAGSFSPDSSTFALPDVPSPLHPSFKRVSGFLKNGFNVGSYNKIGTAELPELIASLLVLYFFYLQWFCLLPSGTSHFENEMVRLSGIKEQTP